MLFIVMCGHLPYLAIRVYHITLSFWMIFLTLLGPFRCAANPTSLPLFMPFTPMLPPTFTAPLLTSKPTTERNLITSPFALFYPLMAQFFVSHVHTHLSKMVVPNVFSALLTRVFAPCSSTHTCRRGFGPMPSPQLPFSLTSGLANLGGTTPLITSYLGHLRHTMIFMFSVAFVIPISPPRHRTSLRLALSLVFFLATNQTPKVSVATTRSPIV